MGKKNHKGSNRSSDKKEKNWLQESQQQSMKSQAESSKRRKC